MKLQKKEISSKIGIRIRKIRSNKKLSIESVANNAEMEYKQLSRIELGEINTTIFQIYKLSIALDTNITEIISAVYEDIWSKPMSLMTLSIF